VNNVGNVCPKVKENTIKPTDYYLKKKRTSILLKSSNLFIDIPIVAEVERFLSPTAGSLLFCKPNEPLAVLVVLFYNIWKTNILS
jgi:hypothetical protein